jgi:hypothetical protein
VFLKKKQEVVNAASKQSVGMMDKIQVSRDPSAMTAPNSMQHSSVQMNSRQLENDESSFKQG